jgi:hypothetical protein
MVRSTGEGKVQYRRMSRGGKSWIMSRLYNYDIESDQLKSKHLRWLKVVYVLWVANYGEVRLRGQASRTGSEEYNLKLSRRRVEEVRKHLLAIGRHAWQPAKLQVGWEGEIDPSPPGSFHYKEEDERPRAVEVEIEMTTRGEKKRAPGQGYTPPQHYTPARVHYAPSRECANRVDGVILAIMEAKAPTPWSRENARDYFLDDPE